MCESSKRYCYRCNNCLALFVSDDYINNCYVAQCAICSNVGVERMGVIGPDRHRKTEKVKCKCDNRCVWATGPLCDCVCGGANHQAGYFGYTKIERDNGIPRLTCTDLATVSKHKSQAEEYRKLVNAVSSLSVDDTPNLRWRKSGVLFKANKSRLHRHRVKILTEFLEKNTKSA